MKAPVGLIKNDFDAYTTTFTLTQLKNASHMTGTGFCLNNGIHADDGF